MAKELKQRINLTFTPDNAKWLKQISEKSGIPMSLFLDAIITGMRASAKEDVTERQAISMAFDQIAKGMRNNG